MDGGALIHFAAAGLEGSHPVIVIHLQSPGRFKLGKGPARVHGCPLKHPPPSPIKH